MVILILGFIIFLAAGAISKTDERLKRFSGPIRGIGILVMVIGILISCVIQIDVGEIGVKKLFGKVQKDVLVSGLHFINPLLQIETLDVKTQNYTMSGVHDEGTKSGDDAIKVLTADGLEVTIDLSVLYRVITNDAPRLLQETGSDYENKIVRPITRT